MTPTTSAQSLTGAEPADGTEPGVGIDYGNCPASGIDDVTPVMPPPEVITGDPSTCRHVVMDEMVGARWGFEDCLGCGKRFPMRDDCAGPEQTEPDYG